MAAEVQSLVLGFDLVFVLKGPIEEILRKTINLEALIKSKALFNIIAKNFQTAELWLQIDELYLRNSYKIEELDHLVWISRNINPADPQTKSVTNPNSTLYKKMKTNKFHMKPEGWAISHARKGLECRIG